MTIPYRPLGLIKEMIETIGLDVTYVYEDIVFIGHNAFLLQMGDEGQDVSVVFNTESKEKARPEMLQRLQRAGKELGLVLTEGGLFNLEQQEEEESCRLEFLPS